MIHRFRTVTKIFKTMFVLDRKLQLQYCEAMQVVQVRGVLAHDAAVGTVESAARAPPSAQLQIL